MTGLRSKRVLVTGATGFIGSNLVRGLLDVGARVHAVVRPESDLWRIRDVAGSLALHRAQITDRRGLARIIQTVEPEIIFHLAATASTRRDDDYAEFLRVNVLGTANLLEAAGSADYERFVHVGSATEYGRKEGPIFESDSLEPVTARGATKAAATLICQQFARQERRPVVILRPFSVYGYREGSTRLVPTAITAALEGREMPLTASVCRRDLVFVEDVVAACLAAAIVPVADGEIVNVASGQEWSNEDVVALVGDLCGRRIATRAGEFPARPNDIAHWVADIGKAERLLGWRPTHSLTEGLRKTIDCWSQVRPAAGAA